MDILLISSLVFIFLLRISKGRYFGIARLQFAKLFTHLNFLGIILNTFSGVVQGCDSDQITPPYIYKDIWMGLSNFIIIGM